MKKGRRSIGYIIVIAGLFFAISGGLYLTQRSPHQSGKETFFIDEKNISNSWLREAVKKQIDKDHNNILSNAEREAVSELKLFIGGESATVKLPELNLFPNLKTLTLEIGGGGKILQLCDLKYIEKLHCISSSLEKCKIEYSDMKKLASLKVTAKRKEYPIAIHIEKCPAIEELQTEGAGVVELGVSSVPAMKHVVMNEASVTNLELHDLPGLEKVTLYCSGDVQKLSLSNLPELKNVELRALYKLKEITLSELENIKELVISDASNLNQIDLRKLKSLKKLELDGTPLSSLDLSSCRDLEEIRAFKMNKVTKLDLEGQKVLQHFEWRNSKLHSIQWGEKKLLAKIDVENNQLTGELDLNEFPILYSLNIQLNKYESVLGRGHKEISDIYGDNNRLKLIDLRNAAKIGSVKVENNEQVTVYLPSRCGEYLDSEDYLFDPTAKVYYGGKRRGK